MQTNIKMNQERKNYDANIRKKNSTHNKKKYGY